MENELIFDNRFIMTAWQLLMSAKSTIDLSFYKAELPTSLKKNKINIIYQALFLKKKEDVRIRFLLNKEQPIKGVSRYNVAVASFLKENKIPCRFLPDNRCCHSKLIIVDKLRFYVGSHNLSNNAVTRNFETGIIMNSEGFAALAAAQFDYLWDDAKEF
jgi:phosphatidylserine/phosphatidylglycerophosphate/cardiolipin synthase-like enzyme